MEIEAANRYGIKPIHQRLGPIQPASDRFSKVCYYWRAGHCNRRPCPYLHSDPVTAGDAPLTKRVHRPNPNVGGGGLVWRNPKTAGKSCPPSKSVEAARPRQIDRVCSYFVAGNCSHGENCKYLHSWFVGDNSFSLLTPLKGHEKVITGIVLPSGSDRLYSGSKDETVRVWDCHTGQCVGVVDMGSEVGCMVTEGPWVFVGIKNAVKAWNLETSTDLSLNGPKRQVYAMVVHNQMLFAGTQDGRILVWKSNAAGNGFEPAASLTGHRLGVVSFVVGASRLYSGSMDNTIRVWDLTTLECIETLTDHTSVVMSLLCWEQFLLSCSLDKTIKVWAATESGKLEVVYTHSEEHGVLALCGMHDLELKPVLFCACNDNTVRLYDLPSFSERGKIYTEDEARAIQRGPDGLFFMGDGTGELKVWKWLSNKNEAASA